MQILYQMTSFNVTVEEKNPVYMTVCDMTYLCAALHYGKWSVL